MLFFDTHTTPDPIPPMTEEYLAAIGLILIGSGALYLICKCWMLGFCSSNPTELYENMGISSEDIEEADTYCKCF
ncbi:MAG: hypothetical protein K0U37_00715 [Gammaproteobacteria bacterium]|nr:hypothetical protein [Gammaproteobacteria bacterium]